MQTELTIQQVGAILGVDSRHVMRLKAEGKLKSVRVPARIGFRREDIVAFLDEHHKVPAKAPTDLTGRLLTCDEVAQAFDVHPGTIRRWVRQWKIPHYVLGPHTIRFSRLELKQWLKENRNKD